MLSCYPKVVSAIQEIQAIIGATALEFESLGESKDKITNDAYLVTMGESRIEEWERLLSIKVRPQSTLEDRRETIIARIRGKGKLNTESIDSIVSTFTGGTANSWVSDSTLYVEITPPPNNKQFIFANVEQELAKKVPAHLGFRVSRNYYDWEETKNTFATWQDVKDNFETWTDVYIFVPFK